MRFMVQLVTQLVCQYPTCGRVVVRGSRDAKHWLDEPHRAYPLVNVVRCPEHWSEWALRNCTAGRTKAMRDRMRKAIAQPTPAIPAWLSPFPYTDDLDRLKRSQEEE